MERLVYVCVETTQANEMPFDFECCYYDRVVKIVESYRTLGFDSTVTEKAGDRGKNTSKEERERERDFPG